MSQRAVAQTASPLAVSYAVMIRPYVHALTSLDGGIEVVELSVVITLAISLLIALPCLALLTYHTTLLAHGHTAFEWQQVRMGVRPRGESLFDYGMLNNFALTLGVYPLLWLLPTRSGIEGNGIFFPEKQHALQSWL